MQRGYARRDRRLLRVHALAQLDRYFRPRVRAGSVRRCVAPDHFISPPPSFRLLLWRSSHPLSHSCGNERSKADGLPRRTEYENQCKDAGVEVTPINLASPYSGDSNSAVTIALSSGAIVGAVGIAMAVFAL